MKFSVKLIAAALCAAMLCVPALAAASAPGAGAYVPNPQYTVISGTVAHQKDGGLLMSTSTGEPTEDYIDLIPILERLYIDDSEFLKPIRKVEVRYV